jgi:NAD+ synthase
VNCVEVSDIIIRWLKTQKVISGTKGFVVGVSGGVDSALTSTLCAMTEMPTILVSMPMSTGHCLAHDHMSWLEKEYLNVRVIESEIMSIFNCFLGNVRLDASNLAKANLQSRIRMAILYMFANTHNCLVVGTGNKVEDYGVGFFTKYGDGGVDISPIGNLLKSQVQQLATYLRVDTKIINAKPTDGLWSDGRTDEDQLGASYKELEWAMKYFDEHHGVMEVGEMQHLTARQKIVLELYAKLHRTTRHKMDPIPICEIRKDLLE